MDLNLILIVLSEKVFFSYPDPDWYKEKEGKAVLFIHVIYL